MSMLPKGGDTVWGGLDWSPEGGYTCSAKRPKNSGNVGQYANQSFKKPESVNYGRIVSFGKDVAEAHSSKFERIDFRVCLELEFNITS